MPKLYWRSLAMSKSRQRAGGMPRNRSVPRQSPSAARPPHRGTCERPVLARIRHESHLDEDHRHVRPVEAGEVRALLDAAVREPEGAEELRLDERRGAPARARRRRRSTRDGARASGCGSHARRRSRRRRRGRGGRAPRRMRSRSGRGRRSPCSGRRCWCASSRRGRPRRAGGAAAEARRRASAPAP